MNLPAIPKQRGERRAPKMAEPGSRIRELWAVVAVDDEGDETLVLRRGAAAPWSGVWGAEWAPMVTADGKAVEMMLAMAKDELLAERPDLRLELRHFATDELCKVISVNRLAALGGLDGR